MKGRGRLHVLFWVDAASLVVLLGLAGTGLVMEFVLPPGSGGGAGHGFRGGRELPAATGTDLLGYTRHQWGHLHYVLAVIFLLLMFKHITLHLEWIKCYFARPGRGAGKERPDGDSACESEQRTLSGSGDAERSCR